MKFRIIFILKNHKKATWFNILVDDKYIIGYIGGSYGWCSYLNSTFYNSLEDLMKSLSRDIQQAIIWNLDQIPVR